MSATRRPVMVGALAAAVIALVASAAVAVGVRGGGVQPGGNGFLSGSSRAAPRLPGTVVNVALTNMGGPMMAQSNGMMGQSRGMMNGGGMRLSADHATTPHGTGSFLVTNSGSINDQLRQHQS